MTYPQKMNDDAIDRLELGAAGILNDVVGILYTAVEHAGLSQAEIAQRMGVGESRISQILNGEGNLRASTLGRFLAALGLKLNLELVEIDQPRSRRKRNRGAKDESPVENTCVWEHVIISDRGSHHAYVIASNIETPGSVIHSTGQLVIDTNATLLVEPRTLAFSVADNIGATWITPFAQSDSTLEKDATLAYS